MQKILKHYVFNEPKLISYDGSSGYANYYLCSELYIIDSNDIFFKLVYILQKGVDINNFCDEETISKNHYLQQYENQVTKINEGDFLVDARLKNSYTLEDIVKEIKKKLSLPENTVIFSVYCDDSFSVLMCEAYHGLREFPRNSHNILELDDNPWPKDELEWCSSHEYDEELNESNWC